MVDLKKEIANLNEVDTAYHDLYVKDGDKYKLKDEQIAKIFNNEKEKNVEAGKKLQAFMKLIGDLKKENEELKAKIKQPEDPKKPEEPKQPEEPKTEIPKNISKEWKAKIEAMTKEKEELNAKMQEILLNQKKREDVEFLKDLVTKKGGNWDILEPHIMKNIKREKDETSGKEVYKVLDPNGNPRWDGSEFFTPDKYIDELKTSDTFKQTFITKKDGTGLNDQSGKPIGEKLPATGIDKLREKIDSLTNKNLLPDRQSEEVIAEKVNAVKEKYQDLPY